MCQQITHYHPCYHFSYGPFLPCNLRYTPTGHFILPVQQNLTTPCPACASRPYHPPLPPPGTTYPYAPYTYLSSIPLQPQQQSTYYPTQPIPIVYLPTQPQPRPQPYYRLPPPGTQTSSLPVPPGTGISTQLERVGNHLEPVIHYHLPPNINTPFPPFVSTSQARAQAGAKVGKIKGNGKKEEEEAIDIRTLPQDWNPNLGHWRDGLLQDGESSGQKEGGGEESLANAATKPTANRNVQMEEVEDEQGPVMSGALPVTTTVASEPVVDGNVQTHGPTLEPPRIQTKEPVKKEQDKKADAAKDAQAGVAEPSAGEKSGQASSSVTKSDKAKSSSQTSPTTGSASDALKGAQAGPEGEDKKEKNKK